MRRNGATKKFFLDKNQFSSNKKTTLIDLKCREWNLNTRVCITRIKLPKYVCNIIFGRVGTLGATIIVEIREWGQEVIAYSDSLGWRK